MVGFPFLRHLCVRKLFELECFPMIWAWRATHFTLVKTFATGKCHLFTKSFHNFSTFSKSKTQQQYLFKIKNPKAIAYRTEQTTSFTFTVEHILVFHIFLNQNPESNLNLSYLILSYLILVHNFLNLRPESNY